MAKPYDVETGSPEMSDFLLKLAAGHGWKNRSFTGELRSWLVIHSCGRPESICWTSCSNGYTVLSINQAVEMLKKGPGLEPEPILVSNCTVESRPVEILPDGVRLLFPYTFISTATIDEIHKRLHAEDEI